MRSKLAPQERPLYWVASTKKDLLAMPEPVVREIGMAARNDYEARYGQTSN